MARTKKLSVSRPRSARRRLVASSLCPPPRRVPGVVTRAHQGNYKRNCNGKDKGNPPPFSLLLSRRRHEGGRGKEQWLSLTLGSHLLGLFPMLPLPYAASPLCCLSPMLPLPEFTLRRLTLDVFPSRGWDLPPHICGGEEAQYRLVAPRIGEEVPDVEPVLASPCLPPHLCPQNFLLAFPVRAALKEMFPCLGPVRAPPVSGCVLVSRPLQVLTG